MQSEYHLPDFLNQSQIYYYSTLIKILTLLCDYNYISRYDTILDNLSIRIIVPQLSSDLLFSDYCMKHHSDVNWLEISVNRSAVFPEFVLPCIPDTSKYVKFIEDNIHLLVLKALIEDNIVEYSTNSWRGGRKGKYSWYLVSTTYTHFLVMLAMYRTAISNVRSKYGTR